MDDFFTLSRIFWSLAVPSNLLIFIAVLGLAFVATGSRRLGLACLSIAVVGQVLTGLTPLPNHIVSPLEERFPPFVPDGRPVDGILLLGGAEVDAVALSRRLPAVNDAGERVIVFAALARQYPEAALVYAGAAQAFGESGATEVAAVGSALVDVGIDLKRVRFETRSRNTAENATFAKAMINPAPGSRWLLVTSAFHMPRAMGCFRAVDFPVIATPVDYRTIGPDALNGSFARAAEGQDLTDVGMKEWVGLAVYYLTGRTNALFPAP
ncbi:YdcF family protein [Aquabacter cavernae]|uniref:YdcF family protein n=1 Tax=Aquabacter cavernae TaxID=2496029 RepID=UPI000F8E5949|nr:YdcF family protein [Aquabacter cavernae]